MTITEFAIKRASKSMCRYRISAIGLNKKGEVIGSAFNKPRFDKLHGGLHAEVNLIRRYQSQLKTIIICRVNAKGKVLPIHPCVKCKELADKLKIEIKSISEDGNVELRPER